MFSHFACSILKVILSVYDMKGFWLVTLYNQGWFLSSDWTLWSDCSDLFRCKTHLCSTSLSQWIVTIQTWLLQDYLLSLLHPTRVTGGASSMPHLQKAHLSHILALIFFCQGWWRVWFHQARHKNTGRLCTVVPLHVYHLSTDEI